MLLNIRAETNAAPIQATEGSGGSELVVPLSDFERSTADYEMRCKLEELAKNKSYRPTVDNLVMNDGGSENSQAANKQELANLRRKVKAQAAEIRTLHSKAHNSLDAVQLHNQVPLPRQDPPTTLVL